jgi:hypothetical protein
MPRLVCEPLRLFAAASLTKSAAGRPSRSCRCCLEGRSDHQRALPLTCWWNPGRLGQADMIFLGVLRYRSERNPADLLAQFSDIQTPNDMITRASLLTLAGLGKSGYRTKQFTKAENAALDKTEKTFNAISADEESLLMDVGRLVWLTSLGKRTGYLPAVYDGCQISPDWRARQLSFTLARLPIGLCPLQGISRCGCFHPLVVLRCAQQLDPSFLQRKSLAELERDHHINFGTWRRWRREAIRHNWSGPGPLPPSPGDLILRGTRRSQPSLY